MCTSRPGAPFEGPERSDTGAARQEGHAEASVGNQREPWAQQQFDDMGLWRELHDPPCRPSLVTFLPSLLITIRYHGHSSALAEIVPQNADFLLPILVLPDQKLELHLLESCYVRHPHIPDSEYFKGKCDEKGDEYQISTLEKVSSVRQKDEIRASIPRRRLPKIVVLDSQAT